MPTPSATKMPSASIAGTPIAYPSDAPMKGAVQGEAIATASTPERNAFTTGCFASSDATLEGTKLVNSNRPARLRPISVKSAASDATTTGDCNWKPQPSCSPAARRPSIAAPSAAKDSTTPAEYATPATRCARTSPPWRAKPITLIARIGNTQGIRFRIRPPINAPSSAAANVIDDVRCADDALLFKALLSTGETAAGAATEGHVPATFASVRHPWSPSASTTGSTAGLW